MQGFIRRKMEQIHEDFLASLNETDRFCHLKGLRFDNGQIPDFENLQLQQRYLLRFFPAYLVEYYELYRTLIQMDFIEGNWNLLSVGCGSGIDYYGLHFAFHEEGLQFNDWVHYTGIDQVDWRYFENLGNPNTRFIRQNILEQPRLDRANYNVIMFPMSIGEFDHHQLQQLKNIFRETPFHQKRIAILAALREVNLELDNQAKTEIVRVFEENGWQLLDQNHLYTRFEDERLNRLFPNNFFYPDEVIDTLTSLSERCSAYFEQERHCVDDCKRLLNRWPILGGTRMGYQVLRLEKITDDDTGL